MSASFLFIYFFIIRTQLLIDTMQSSTLCFLLWHGSSLYIITIVFQRSSNVLGVSVHKLEIRKMNIQSCLREVFTLPRA